MKENKILQVQMFERFYIRDEENILDEEQIRSDMVTKLLIYILIHHKKQIRIQELSEALWQEGQSDNPIGALKNLMYRLRSVLKKEWGEQNYIITGRGVYFWNPELSINIDAEEFEQLYKQAVQTSDKEEKITYYRDALKLYKGIFLPNLSGEYWAASMATYYHSMYLSAVKSLARLLEEENRYEEMGRVCSGAIHLDALDEEIQCLFIQALIGQNKQNLAIEQYHKAVEILYDNLGVKPSDAMRQLYTELLKRKHDQELDLGLIQDELRSDDDRKGAFLCEYGVFKKAYHLEARRAMRYGVALYLSLITLFPSIPLENNSDAYLKIINSGMNAMQDALMNVLRNGDVVARYSSSQFIVMLPQCTDEASRKVMERIQERFYTENRKLKVRIQYSIEEMELYDNKSL